MKKISFIIIFVIAIYFVGNLSRYQSLKVSNEKFDITKIVKVTTHKKENKLEIKEITGESLYKKCSICHGTDAMGDIKQKAPRIAGQHDWYLITQISNIKNKKRINKIMDSYVKNLSDEDIKKLADYISKLKAF